MKRLSKQARRDRFRTYLQESQPAEAQQVSANSARSSDAALIVVSFSIMLLIALYFIVFPLEAENLHATLKGSFESISRWIGLLSDASV